MIKEDVISVFLPGRNVAAIWLQVTVNGVLLGFMSLYMAVYSTLHDQKDSFFIVNVQDLLD